MDIFDLMETVVKYELLIAPALAALAIVGTIVARGKASSPKDCDEDKRTFFGALLFWLACLGTVILCMIEAFSIFMNALGVAFIGMASAWVGTGDSDAAYFVSVVTRNILACIIAIAGIIASVLIGRKLKKKYDIR